MLWLRTLWFPLGCAVLRCPTVLPIGQVFTGISAVLRCSVGAQLVLWTLKCKGSRSCEVLHPIREHLSSAICVMCWARRMSWEPHTAYLHSSQICCFSYLLEPTWASLSALGEFCWSLCLVQFSLGAEWVEINRSVVQGSSDYQSWGNWVYSKYQMFLQKCNATPCWNLGYMKHKPEYMELKPLWLCVHYYVSIVLD